MIFLKNKIYWIFIFSFSLFLTLSIFQTNPVDYWAYINQAKLILDNKIIYEDFFSHKGPVFPLFLANLFNFLNFGLYQAWIIAGLIFFLFFFVITKLSNKENSSKQFLLTIIFASTGIFNKIDLNLLMDLFLCILLISSFFFLKKFLDKKKKINFYLGFFILSLGTFVRIDFLIYSIFLSIFFFSKKFIDNLKLLVIVLFINFIVLLSLVLLLKFNIENFISNNIFFNLLYKSKLFSDKIGHFLRERHYVSLMTTGFLPLALITFFLDSRITKFKIFLLNQRSNLSYWYLLSGLILWIIVGSGKDYHVIILLGPIIIFLTDKNKIFNELNPSIKFTFFLIALYSSILTVYPNYILLKNYNNCLSSNPCLQSDLYLDKVALDEIKKTTSPIYIIAGSGYIGTFSNNINSITENAWFYIFEEFNNKKIELNYKNLLKLKKQVFFIHKSILTRGNKKLKKLIEISNYISSYGNYAKYKIK